MTPPTQPQTKQPAQQPMNLSPETQQNIGLLTVRFQDFIAQTNKTIDCLIKENQLLQQKIVELQVPVKEKQPQ